MDSELAGSSLEGDPIFTCPCCKEDIDLDKIFNHLGPEMTYFICHRLLKLVDDDFNQAMNESNNFNE